MKKVTRERLKQWWWSQGLWVLGLVVVVAGFMGWVVGQASEFFFVDDSYRYFLPAYVYNWRAVVEEGTIPFINFHQFMGTRHLGQGQTGVFYLPAYAAVGWSNLIWGDYLQTLVLLHWFHLSVAAVGMWVWLVKLRIGQTAAFWWSLVWLTLPFNLNIVRVWVFYGALLAYLPWGLRWFEEFVESRGKSNRSRLVAAKVGLISCGYVQWGVVVGLLELLLLGLWWANGALEKKKMKKAIGGSGRLETIKYFLAMWVVVGMVTAVIWLPLAGMVKDSASRSGPLDLGEMLLLKVDGVGWLKAQVGLFEYAEVFNLGNYLFFVGPVLVGMFVAGWWGNRGWWKRRWGWLSWYGLVFSTVIYGLFYLVPGLNWFRYPIKNYGLFLMFLVVFVAQVCGRQVNAKIGRGGVLLGLFLLGTNLWVWQVIGDLDQIRCGETRGCLGEEGRINELLELVDEEGRVVVTTSKRGTISEKAEAEVLMLNYPTLYKRYGVAGYDPLVSAGFVEKADFLMRRGVVLVEEVKANLDRLRSWGVKYWLVQLEDRTNEELEQTGWRKLGEVGEVVVYKDELAKPVVGWRDGSIVKYEYGVNQIKAWVDRPGELVLRIAPLEGYRVWLDGKYAGKPRVLDNGFGVGVPAGTRLVEVTYIDWSFWVGLAVSGLGVAGWWAYLRGGWRSK